MQKCENCRDQWKAPWLFLCFLSAGAFLLAVVACGSRMEHDVEVVEEVPSAEEPGKRWKSGWRVETSQPRPSVTRAWRVPVPRYPPLLFLPMRYPSPPPTSPLSSYPHCLRVQREHSARQWQCWEQKCSNYCAFGHDEREGKLTFSGQKTKLIGIFFERGEKN